MTRLQSVIAGIWLAVIALVTTTVASAAPTRLVADLSQSHVDITSGYHGTELLLFGAYEGVPGDELVLVVRSSLAFATADRRCLTLAEGDVVVCWPEREAPAGWARGRNGGREGVFPLSYVRALRMVPPRSSLPLLEAAKKEEAKEEEERKPTDNGGGGGRSGDVTSGRGGSKKKCC